MDTTHRNTATPAALRAFALGAVLTLGALPAYAQTGSPPAAETERPADAEPQRLEAVEVAAERQLELPPQEVPGAVTAFEAERIDVMKVRNLTNLSIGLPNVQLDDRSVARGVAHFSIRGMGANSSLPALDPGIDPSVGVFVDGVYVGTTVAALHDVYDLESIEILRGPQSTLFGRNVVGGAVLLETKRPTDRYEATVRSSVEGGGKAPNVYVSGMLNAPLTETLGVRLNVYSNQDQGWFENEHDGRAFGTHDYVSLRPVVSWQPTETLDLTLRYEWQDGDGDGPAVQSRGVYDRDSHDFAIDETGYARVETHFFNLRADWDVALGHGTVTNIFGWRDARLDTLGDVDATPRPLFTSGATQTAEQVSNELRYTGVFFDRLFLTTGFYYFTNEVLHHDRFDFPTRGDDHVGGGDLDLESFALFLNGDYDLTDRLTLTAGLRWTRDEKDATVTSMLQHRTECHVVDGPTCPRHHTYDESWNHWSPKVGLSYRFDEQTLVYGHWRRGHRPGGYNLRDLSYNLYALYGPGGRAILAERGFVLTDEFNDLSFDDERVDTFELGVKKTFGPRTYVNAVFFYNFIDDVQRHILFTERIPLISNRRLVLDERGNAVTAGSIIVPLTRNAGDAETWGFEVEGSVALTPDLTVLGSAGYLEADYTKMRYDVNLDGRVDGQDKDLEIPRAPTWTYSLGVQHTLPLGLRHRLVSRVNYAYRDKAYNTTDNLGFNRQQKIVDAGMDLFLDDGQWVVGLYGRNLLDFARAGTDSTVVPLVPGGTTSPLQRGRTFGLELTYNFRGV